MEIEKLVKIIWDPQKVIEGIEQYRRDSVFIEENHQNLMEMHSGQWIAVKNEELVAHEDGFEELFIKLDALGIERQSTVIRFLDPNPPTHEFRT